MGYKIKYVMKKSAPVFIIATILWVALSVVLIAPISRSVVESTVNGKFEINQFNDIIITNFQDITGSFKQNFKSDYINTYKKGELYLSLAIFGLLLVGFIKMMPNNEYTDIEHGSGDWAEHGEQYEVLNPKKGILLAEKNYLPVNKRGNTNVLIVGRFWFW